MSRLLVRKVYNSIAVAGMRGPRALLAAAPLQSSHSHCLSRGTGKATTSPAQPAARQLRGLCAARKESGIARRSQPVVSRRSSRRSARRLGLGVCQTGMRRLKLSRIIVVCRFVGTVARRSRW